MGPIHVEGMGELHPSDAGTEAGGVLADQWPLRLVGHVQQIATVYWENSGLLLQAKNKVEQELLRSTDFSRPSARLRKTIHTCLLLVCDIQVHTRGQ